jgi:hypothetical protein
LPANVIEDSLNDFLVKIRVIRGIVSVSDNRYLTSLSFMRNVESIDGISLANNPNLVDARLPSLTYLGGSVAVASCFRLCPARYPSVKHKISDDGCASLKVI